MPRAMSAWPMRIWFSPVSHWATKPDTRRPMVMPIKNCATMEAAVAVSMERAMTR